MTRTRALHTLAAAAGVLALAATAQAQRVYWERPERLGVGERAALDLVFADTQPAGRIVPPRVDDVAVVGPPSEESNISIVNGRRSATTTLSYPVRASREGTFTVPSFEVDTTDGPQTVEALTFEVGAAAAPRGARSGSAADQLVDVRLTPSEMRPYAGQVIDLDVRVGLEAGRNGQVVGTPTWDGSALVAEPWSEGQPVAGPRGGSSVHFHTRAVVPAAGRTEIGPVRQDVQVETAGDRSDPFDGFDDAFDAFRKFGGANLFSSFFGHADTPVTVKSNSAQLDVQPLPQPAPAGFTGAIGHFAIDTTVAPEQPKTGEPITWTLTLKGAGNWPGGVELPARAVPADVRTLQPKQHKDFAEGALFEGAVSEDLVMVANRPGGYELAPVRFVYFDPDTGTYQTIEARPPALRVTGTPIEEPAKSAPAPAGAAAAASTAAAAAPPTSEAPSALLPRDPRHGAATGVAPLAMPAFAAIAALPCAALALYWLALALQRSRLRDPRRPQRGAYRQLAPAIARVRAAGTVQERLVALLAWQRTAALALGIDLAAPTATQISDPRWAAVWADSERALYGPAHALASGWCDRASMLCTRPRRPLFGPFRTRRLRRLVPKAAMAAGLIAVAVLPARGADPLDAYAAGDFAAARKDLLARTQEAPADWIARYNLGLSEAQSGDAPRALGETLAAFVHAPRDADVRWNMRAFAAAVPGAAAAAALAASPAAVLSPAGWQALLIIAAALVSTAAALRLRRHYRPGTGLRWPATAFALGGIAIGSAALLALHAYGPLADPRAAVVAGRAVLRSVPTDAEAAQQQRPIPAGSSGVAERSFLGWTKIQLRSGESGWVRSGDLVPLYAAPAS